MPDAALKQNAVAAEELERLNEQLDQGLERERYMHEQQLEERQRVERLAGVMQTLSELTEALPDFGCGRYHDRCRSRAAMG